MPIELSWQQPKKVLYQRFYGVITIDQLTATQQTLLQYLDEGIPPIHAVIDLTDVTDYPKSLAEIRRGLVFTGTKKLERVVIVTNANQLIRFISSMIAQLVLKNAHVTFCDTLEEAAIYLRSRDSEVTVDRYGA